MRRQRRPGWRAAGRSRVKAASSGTYVLAIGPSCHHGGNGPFAFTVTVSHKAGLSRTSTVRIVAPTT
jgi:hypothetical protein